ncbi:hypothetical protein AMEX_G525 [Astyanax mexicanus]|uniref:Uncharacterized protein n=1 Tax=Astyanax mexicanus TaxID=7994 RepID=A0A8T2MIZ4_ASTMX|nr:hypothetical protein AMEX_G525 [Astyanax mexicanus]
MFLSRMTFELCHMVSRVAPAPFKTTRTELIKYFIVLAGNTLNCHVKILECLSEKRNLRKVSNAQDCHVILVFCPIVSRAGTDIESALKKLNEESDTKPAVLMVLHHTFDSDSIVSDSRNAVRRENTDTVDILFHEDRGLLNCSKNDMALRAARKSLTKLRKIATGMDRKTLPNHGKGNAFECDRLREDPDTDDNEESTTKCFCLPKSKKSKRK